MDYKKLWPTLIPLLTIVADMFSGQISSLLAAHPTASLVVVGFVTLLANVVNPAKKV